MGQYREEVIKPGDAISKLAKEVNVASYRNCPALHIVPHKPKDFRGPVGWLWKNTVLREMLKTYLSQDGKVVTWTMLEEAGVDGAGGKPGFFTLLGTPEAFAGLGEEIIAMCADDRARSGALACIMMNQVDFWRVTGKNYHLAEAMFSGYGKILERCGLVNLTGETAIMKHSITGAFDTGDEAQLVLNWSGSCIGLSHHELHLDGSKIHPGMCVVGFQCPGYRCNGGGLLTRITKEVYGPETYAIYNNPEAMKFIKAITVPSQSYARTWARMLGWNRDGSIRPANERFAIAALANVSGGGWWEKFCKLLPLGMGANLSSMPLPAPVLLQAQKLSEKTSEAVSDYECYGSFHGGCGGAVVCEEADVERVIEEALVDGIRARLLGKITSDQRGEVFIRSRFAKGKILSSLNPE